MTIVKVRRIGVLTNGLLSSYQWSLFEALRRAAQRHGCSLSVAFGRELQHVLPSDCAQNVLFDWFTHDAVDGLVVLTGVLVNFSGTQAVVDLLERLRPLPAVSLGLDLTPWPSVTVDNRGGMANAVEHLITKHNCTNIAYISGPSDNAEAIERLAGYRDARQQAGFDRSSECVIFGNFSLSTGKQCLEELLRRGHHFDAVVAANDYMALGAMEALRDHGFAIPRQMRVVGFDDSALAPVSVRPLTSVAQPTDAMAERALVTLLATLNESSPLASVTLKPELTRRESCGCESSDELAWKPSVQFAGTAEKFVEQSRSELIAALQSAAPDRAADWHEEAAHLVDAMAQDLGGRSEAFATALDRVADTARARGIALEHLRAGLVSAQGIFLSAGIGPAALDVERLWLRSWQILSEATGRAHGRDALDLFDQVVDLRYATQRLSLALEPLSLARELENALTRMGIRNCAIALLTEDGQQLRPLLVLDEGISVPQELYSRFQLFPANQTPRVDLHFFVMVLSFEREVTGIFIVEANTPPVVAELLRTQISSAVQVVSLHRQVVEQVAVRGRAVQIQQNADFAVARQVQLALAPRDLQLEHLEICGATQPAYGVGGDYHDVLPVPGGAWLCLADVTGHGLLSGLVMLMIQSMVSALVQASPDTKASELLIELNRSLRKNLSERLKINDYATVVAAHVSNEGQVTYAGAHEDIIVWRRETRRCEFFQTDGMWIGISDDIREVTKDSHFELQSGDLLILISDGLIEAHNAQKQEFGMDRLCELIVRWADKGPGAVRDAMLKAVASWAPHQEDDLTCLVARYFGATGRAPGSRAQSS